MAVRFRGKSKAVRQTLELGQQTRHLSSTNLLPHICICFYTIQGPYYATDSYEFLLSFQSIKHKFLKQISKLSCFSVRDNGVSTQKKVCACWTNVINKRIRGNSLLGCQLEDQRRISRPSFISTFWVFLVKVSACPIFFLA